MDDYIIIGDCTIKLEINQFMNKNSEPLVSEGKSFSSDMKILRKKSFNFVSATVYAFKNRSIKID